MNKKVTTFIIVIAAIAVSLYICKDKIWPQIKEKQHIVPKERVAKDRYLSWRCKIT